VEAKPTTPTGLYRTATRAALLGLVVNPALGVVKLVGGIVGRSFALISDAINSLGDSLSSVVVLGALWYSQRPADEEHPYGHTRAEAVAASNVALLIVISASSAGLGQTTFGPTKWRPWSWWQRSSGLVESCSEPARVSFSILKPMRNS